MKEIITLSMESVKKKLKIPANTKGQGCCFELFGYDFIIDGDFGVWLIEVNTNPCLEESS
jgi:D-alanine-D-alanine ligase-like ATP-grasp enzyme